MSGIVSMTFILGLYKETNTAGAHIFVILIVNFMAANNAVDLLVVFST